MRDLGPNQKGVLDALKRHGGYSPGGGWVWDNHSGTIKILDSLVNRGLVIKEEKTYKRTGGTYNVYRLAQTEGES